MKTEQLFMSTKFTFRPKWPMRKLEKRIEVCKKKERVRDLRSFLQALELRGELVRIRKSAKSQVCDRIFS